MTEIKSSPWQDLAATITEDSITSSLPAFTLFDHDSDGTITHTELGTVLKSLRQDVTDKDLKEMIDEVDSDNSGTLDFGEFITMMKRRGNTKGYEDEFVDAFRHYDEADDGLLNEKELMSILNEIQEITPPSAGEQAITWEEVKKIMKENGKEGADENRVNYKDLVSVLLNKKTGE